MTACQCQTATGESCKAVPTRSYDKTGCIITCESAEGIVEVTDGGTRLRVSVGCAKYITNTCEGWRLP
jgi:hypothetical protein